MLLEINTDKDTCFNKIKELWREAEDGFPDFLSEISNETKSQNEEYIKDITEFFQKQIKSYPRLPICRKKWIEKSCSKISEVLYKETIIGIHNSISKETLDAFQDELFQFLRNVREFAPELSFEEIGQAIRNYIVYAMFKEVSGVKLGFNMAGFGYSMLYPFTDNYIDNRNCSEKEKTEYNKFIRDKLEGRQVHPNSLHQQKTGELLDAIESEFPKNSDRTVNKLLLLMLDAQEKSLMQQNQSVKLTYEERLDISIYKGGISVFIDRVLVKKQITEDELLFYLGLGFFLQLADDLQDIKEDNEKGYQTIFTTHLNSEHEEKIVNKILNFIHHVMDSYKAENDIFKYFILSNCYQLVYLSVVGSSEFFSKEYLNQLERYLPVSYPFLKKHMQNRFEDSDSVTQEKYMKMLDEILFLKAKLHYNSHNFMAYN